MLINIPINHFHLPESLVKCLIFDHTTGESYGRQYISGEGGGHIYAWAIHFSTKYGAVYSTLNIGEMRGHLPSEQFHSYGFAERPPVQRFVWITFPDLKTLFWMRFRDEAR